MSFHTESAYFQYSEPTSGHLDNHPCTSSLEGRRVIVCDDVNAKSILWRCVASDSMGELVEDLIASHGLHLLNSNQWVTFRNLRGSSSIDVKLVTGSMLPFVVSWTIRTDATMNDNQLTGFLLDSSDPFVASRTPLLKKSVKFTCYKNNRCEKWRNASDVTAKLSCWRLLRAHLHC